MNDSQKEQLIKWLNDAYSMEKDITQKLEEQVGQLEDMPEVREKIQEHLDITKDQAERVKGCIERLGGDISGVKSTMATMMGTVTGKSAGLADDSIIKNGLADFATEHFEIAAYMALVETARILDDKETAQVCEEIMQEEQEMADWLKDNLPNLVKKYVSSLE